MADAFPSAAGTDLGFAGGGSPTAGTLRAAGLRVHTAATPQLLHTQLGWLWDC